jgi:hypothetical protein
MTLCDIVLVTSDHPILVELPLLRTSHGISDLNSPKVIMARILAAWQLFQGTGNSRFEVYEVGLEVSG